MSIISKRFSCIFTKQVVKNYFKCTATQIRFSSKKTNKEDDSKKENKLECAVLKKFNEPLIIKKLDLPKKIKSKEVLIDVNYCALNGVDVLICEKLYNKLPDLPFIPGYEICGKIAEVGEDAKKAGYHVGDKVVALNKDRYGGLSDLCISELNDVWKIPSEMKSIDAVCLMENYMTALIALETYGSIAEEDMILINVGIGGISLAAVDIAANIFLAKVLGVGFSEERADKIRERGAFYALTYNEKKLRKKIQEIAKEKDIDDVFEGDSGEKFKKVLDNFMDIYESKVPSKDLLRDDNLKVVVQHLSKEGRLLIAGVSEMNSDENETDGICLRDFRKRKHDSYRQIGDDVITFLEEGLVKPVPSMIAGLYNINEAVKFISEMKSIGKVVIDIKNKDAEAKIKT